MRSILFSFLAVFVLSSCQSERSEQLDSYHSMDSFYDQHKQEEQEFVVDTGGSGPIVGKMGTRLYGDSSIFMLPGGGDVSYPYTVKLIELYTPKDIIFYNTPTTDGSDPLRSGGEIRVRAYKGSTELVLKPGKSGLAEMPSANPETGMKTFYAAAVDAPKEWYTNNTAVSTIPGYYQVVVDKMGWINCDKFYSYTTAKTNITFTADGTGTEFIDVFIVFKDFLSVLMVENLQSGNVPVGEDITVIAMALDQNGKLRLHNSSETISAGMSVHLNMKEVSEQELLDALGAL